MPISSTPVRLPNTFKTPRLATELSLPKSPAPTSSTPVDGFERRGAPTALRQDTAPAPAAPAPAPAPAPAKEGWGDWFLRKFNDWTGGLFKDRGDSGRSRQEENQPAIDAAREAVGTR